MSGSNRSFGMLVAGLVIGVIVGALGYRAFLCTSCTMEAQDPVPAPVAAVEPVAPVVPAVEEIAQVDEPPVEPVAELPPDPEPEFEEPAEEPAANPNQERTQRIVQAQMKLLADMVYKPFYEGVEMDPATQAAAAELFVESFAEQQRIQQQAMRKGDQTASEVKAETDALRDELREQLGGVLNETQLASWEEYDAYSDRVLFEALLDGQLRMLAPNLSIESHQATMATMADELAQSIDRFEASSKTYDMDSFNDAQLEGLTTAMQHLQSELDAEQAGHAQGFVDQVKVMFDAMKSQPAQP